MLPSGTRSAASGARCNARAPAIPQPFILTAALPPDLANFAEGLRRAHYPAEKNHLHAHVTLFHAFAPSLLEEAIALDAPELLRLRARVAEHFRGSLTAQDLHEPRPHITIQNKVTKEEARALQAGLAPVLAPWIKKGRFAFPALALHRYRGGPWEPIKTSAFRGRERA